MKAKNAVYEFYCIPVMRILRIRDLAKHWDKEMGMDGYFKFLGGYLGTKIPNDDKMNYTVIQQSAKNRQKLG